MTLEDKLETILDRIDVKTSSTYYDAKEDILARHKAHALQERSEGYKKGYIDGQLEAQKEEL